ncbi:MAG: Ig-like domain-containing protein [Verrucomicrobia bacterium]|nr:Ig-like domain-containing protein [Verrucomicrobiota bacterium]
MAAPHVTGVVALMLEVNPNLTPCEVQAILEHTARDLGAPGKDPRYGSGLVDAQAALLAALEFRSNPAAFDHRCAMTLVSTEPHAPVHALNIDSAAGKITASPLNTSSVPWEVARSIAADAEGQLYVTATGGFGPGLYRLDRAGSIQAVAVGPPFVMPQGLSLDRDGTILVADRSTRAILRVTPAGAVTLLHEGDPLREPTSIAYADFQDVCAVADAVGSDGTGPGGIYRFIPSRRLFTPLLMGAGDFEDVVASVPNNILFLAIAPMGNTSGALLAFTPYSAPENVQQAMLDLGESSTEGWRGIGYDYGGDFWFADRDPTGGAVANLYQNNGQLWARSLPLPNLPEPADIAPIPPTRGPISPPELIHLIVDHLFLDQIGDLAPLPVWGRLSDDRLISLDHERQAGRLQVVSHDEGVVTFDPQGIATARAVGIAPLSISRDELRTRAFACVGAVGLQLHHPATPLSAAGAGDFAVPFGHPGVRLQVQVLLRDGSRYGLDESLARYVYRSDNNAAVLVGVGAASGWLNFTDAGSSRITVVQGPLSAHATVTVQGQSPVALVGIEIPEDSLTLRVGQRHELRVIKRFSSGATGEGANLNAGHLFASTQPAVASVDPLRGWITATAPGQTSITVANGSWSDSLLVTVTPANQPPVARIKTPALDVTRQVGAGIVFSGEAHDPDGTITRAWWNFAGAWPNRAGLDTGPVSFQKPGSYQVEFVVCDNEFTTNPQPDRRRITILPTDVTLQSLEILEGNLTLHVGEERPLTVIGHYSNGSTQFLSASMSQTRYGSSATAVARVSTEGLVRAVASGECTVNATNTTLSTAIRVTVTAPPTLVTLRIVNGNLHFVQPGARAQLQVIGSYSDQSERDLTSAASGTRYLSSEPGVASVSANGLIAALENGTTVITSSQGQIQDTIQVTVDLPTPPNVSIMAVKTMLEPGERTYLYWQSQHATYTTLDPYIGTGFPIGRREILPEATTTYQIVAHGPGGTAEAQVTVQVAPPATTPSVTFEKLGTVGGNCHSVSLSGSIACIGEGSGLVTVDVSDPHQPRFRGRVQLKQPVAEVQTWGSYACAADDDGLHILDLGNPTAPRRLGGVAGLMQPRVALANRHAYAAGGTYGFHVVNLDNPAHPLPVGSYAPEHWTCLSVAVSGHLACATGYFLQPSAERPGFWLIDVTDPSHPREVGRLETESFPAPGVVISGAHALWCNEQGELLTANISNPAAPQLANTTDLELSWGVHDIALAGPNVYLAVDDRAAGLRVVNIANPAQPVPGLTLALPSGGAHRVSIANNRAYVTSTYGGGVVEIVDLSSPSSPQLLSCYQTLSSARNLSVEGNQVFVADTHAGLIVVDRSDPAKPFTAARATGPRGRFSGYDVQAVAGQVFVGTSEDGLLVFSETGPAGPTLLNQFNYPALGIISELAVEGDHAFLASAGDRFVVLGLPPSTDDIVKLARLNTGASELDLAHFGQRVYVGRGFGGLAVVDTSTPHAPTKTGQIDVPCFDVAAYGNLALVASANDRPLVVIDSSGPLELGAFSRPSTAADLVEFANGAAYLTCGQQGLFVVDLADPAHPALTGRFVDPALNGAWSSAYSSIAIAGRDVILGHDSAGLTILRTHHRPDHVVMPITGNVEILFRSMEARYINEIWLELPHQSLIFTATVDHLGTIVDLGLVRIDTVLGFALKIPDGLKFYSDRDLNPDDGASHVIVRQLSPLVWEYRWEDTRFLGDRDYDDVVMEVRVTPPPE